jgi:hypothetical protein
MSAHFGLGGSQFSCFAEDLGEPVCESIEAGALFSVLQGATDDLHVMLSVRLARAWAGSTATWTVSCVECVEYPRASLSAHRLSVRPGRALGGRKFSQRRRGPTIRRIGFRQGNSQAL